MRYPERWQDVAEVRKYTTDYRCSRKWLKGMYDSFAGPPYLWRKNVPRRAAWNQQE